MILADSDYWEAVVNTMTDGLMVVDRDCIIVSVNKAMETMTGYSREELIGERCSIIGCDICFKIVRGKKVWKCMLFSKGDFYKEKCSFQRKDGHLVHVWKNATVFKNRDGKIIGGVETFTDLSEIIKRDQQLEQLHHALDKRHGFHGILGRSPSMQRVFELIQNAAQSDAPAIIYGESGSGKELVAHAIHSLGKRKKGPFIRVNCSALNESLLESELFGYVKGAFTGAYDSRKGRFEAADKGDILLDEIGDLPMSTQVKLLRVLEEKEIERVGDYHPVKIDVRIISSTHRNLNELIRQEKFREDLFYRLHVIPIVLPPLRKRMEDIPMLVEAFVKEIALRTNKPIHGIKSEVMELFTQYSWPGNIRELINVLEYAFVVCPDEYIDLQHLPEHLLAASKRIAARPMAIAGAEDKDRLIWALNQAQGKKTEAARILGVSRQTLWKRINKYGIEVKKNVTES